MIRFLASIVLMSALSVVAMAEPIFISTHVVTAATTQSLCSGARGHLGSVCANNDRAGGVTIYNSDGQVSNALAVVQTTGTPKCMPYNVYMSSGVTFTTGGTADVTITYGCY